MDYPWRENYLEALARLHRTFRPRVYLEIGVQTGRSFDLSRAPVSIGVDPEPLTDDPRVLRMTSDEYFAAPAWDGYVDLAFIDGLHEAGQTLRDIANIAPMMAPDGLVCVHDTLPISAETATPEPQQGHWTGDVWKAVAALTACGVKMETIFAEPSGLTVIRAADLRGVNLAMPEEIAEADFAFYRASWRDIHQLAEN